jgi:hypothetical protein
MKQVKIVFDQRLLDSAPNFNPKAFVKKLNKKLKGKRAILAKGKRK